MITADCIQLPSIMAVFWQWNAPVGTITYENKRFGDGLPAPNGITDKTDSVFL